MSLTIDLPDHQVAALQAKAAAQGLTLEAWLGKLAEDDRAQPERGTVRAAAEIVLEEMSRVPSDVSRTTREDGASQHDHYLYGWRKAHDA